MEPTASGGGDRPAAAEDEVLKRNTDCVYFLASPLTCKKGSECEYRHSEGARVNPRDCWYWLNGNCLNPKCSFRHPPLDGLYGPPGTTSGTDPPLSQAVSSVQIPATHARTHNFNKQSVPCYYFQKGACLKGDMCPFMHGPQNTGNPGPHTSSTSVPQQVAKVPAAVTEQSQTLKKDSWGLKKCTIQQPKASVEKPTEVLPPSAKPTVKVEASSSNVLSHKRSLSPYLVDNKLPESQPLHAPVSSNDASAVLNNHLPHVPLSSNDAPTVLNNRQLQPVEEHLHNDYDTNEVLRESSPGFDVIVHDDGEDPDYFHNGNDYGRASTLSRRNRNPVTDFEYQHAEFEPVLQFERDQYSEMGEYEQDERVHSRHGWEQHRRSSERVLDRRSMPDRRTLEREETFSEINGSDLRHQLLKQRRLNDSRSVVNADHRREPYQGVDRYVEERHRRHSSSRDQRRYQESSISTRLQGRITLPRRSSPDNPVDFRSRKERERERHRSRLSPAPPINNHQGKQHDRITRRPNEEFTTDVRNSDRQLIKREDTEFLDFPAPKSLAELKGTKIAESSQDQPIEEQRSLKPVKALSHQESQETLSFEGPKPLSVILKRKRETVLENGAMSSSGDENHKKGRTDFVSDEEEEEGQFHEVGEELRNDGHSSAKGEFEVQDNMIVETHEDRDLEGQRDGESDYEVTEGGDFRNDDNMHQHEVTEGGDFRTDDDNMHQHDVEDLDDGNDDDDDGDDDDDDDDFARKIGMILS